MAGYAIFGLFFVLEARLRQGEEAKSLQAGRSDAGTTRLLGLCYGISLAGAPMVARLDPGRIALPGIVGPAIMIAGLALRIWAASVLGRFYSRTLRVADNHTLVQRGPYRIIRHPGYLGAVLMWAGFGLTTASRLASVTVAALMCWVYHRRIQAEEALLVESLGKPYRDYLRTTWRWIPGLY
jgi:protein-S-isoprenylcysteine O-methyltransferase Ste14